MFRLRSFTPDRGFVLYHHQTCLGAGYDKEACGKYFLPQLLLYFLRFLDIYDNSLKGALMDNYLEELKRMQMVHMSTTTITTSSPSFLRRGVIIGDANHKRPHVRLMGAGVAHEGRQGREAAVGEDEAAEGGAGKGHQDHPRRQRRQEGYRGHHCHQVNDGTGGR